MPLPFSTLDVVYALKPPTEKPLRLIPSATPRIRAAEVFLSSSQTDRSEVSTVSCGKPSDFTVMIPSSVGTTNAITSRLTAAARTFPRLWSVWFPPISVRPEAEKIMAFSASPNSSPKVFSAFW